MNDWEKRYQAASERAYHAENKAERLGLENNALRDRVRELEHARHICEEVDRIKDELEERVARLETERKRDVWRFDSNHYTLTYMRDERAMYELNLEQLRTPTIMLDWIMQVASKTWATNEVIGALVKALWFIFRPQQTMCGLGQAKEIDPRTVMDDYVKRINR